MAIPLTTIFTPSPSCTTDLWMFSPGPYFLLGPSATSDCLPFGFDPARTAYFSPGICPEGYTEACWTVGTGGAETVATCCPSAYECNPDTQLFWFTTLKCSSQILTDVVLRFTSSTDTGTVIVTRAMTGNYDGLNAYGIGIKYQQTDRASTGSTSTGITGATITAQTTASLVPALVLEPITTGPPTAAPIYSPLPSYSGQGDLLQDYCITPDYVLLDGPTAYWAPVVGCVGGKSDCCPYAVQSATSTSATTVYVVSTVTVDVGPSGETQAPYGGSYAGLQAYPTPVSSNQATLAHCPGDYVSVSGGCCPLGYQLWNAPLGGQTPCYSSLSSYLVPPAVPVSNYEQQITVSANITGAAASSFTTEPNQKPTSAVVNIVFAVQFLVLPSSGLSTGVIAGIGVGAGLGGIAIIVLSLLLVWRPRKHKKDLTAMQQREGQIANGQSQNGMSEATSPYAYSQRTELETHGTPQAVLTPGGFVPQEQNGYFQQQQMQQGQPSQYYGQQPAHQMQGQSPVQYPSPVASTVSPQPTGLDGYSQQTGYAGTIPPSTRSPPLQEGYGYHSSYAAPVSELGPNSASYSAPGSATYVSPNPTGSPAPGERYGYQGGYNPTGNELHHPQAQ